MKSKFQNELYCLVDESFISEFDEVHQSFMKNYYYKYYSKFAKSLGCKVLTKKAFFTNMRKRRIKLYQLCCPFCGTIEIIPQDRAWKNTGGLNYCSSCGRDSTISVCFEHLARYVRLSKIIEAGLSVKKKEHKDADDWLIGYESYQMELITLVSIIEVVFRDCFEALLFINNLNVDKNRYLQKCIAKAMGNDFMLLEKANDQYKKAFGLDLKTIMDEDTWNDLVDIANLRNIFIHNNGLIDDRFRNTKTYERLKHNEHVDLYCLKKEDVKEYYSSVTKATLAITGYFYREYYRLRQKAIANHYFNTSN